MSVTNSDDDDAGLAVGAVSGNTTEAGGTATFTVALDTEPTVDVVIAVSSADTGEGAVSPARLTFTPADYGAQTVTATGVDDHVDDGDATYTIELAAAGDGGDPNYAALDPVAVGLTNTDGDEAPTRIVLTVDEATAPEGATTAITVTAAFPPGSATLTTSTEVSVTVLGGGSKPATGGGVDFDDVADFAVTIAAGEISGSGQPFDLAAVADHLAEGAETVQVAGAAAGFAAVTPVDITIADGDTAPSEITLTMTPSIVSKGAGETDITVTATLVGHVAFAEPMMLTAKLGGSGNDGAVDFRSLPSFDLIIPTGERSASMVFPLLPEDDAVDEADETVTASGTLVDAGEPSSTPDPPVPAALRAASASGGEDAPGASLASGLTVHAADLLLMDDDTAMLSIDDATVLENAGTAVFGVRLSLASAQTVSVAYDTAAGTATAGADYRSTRGRLTFAAGEREKVVEVPVLDDEAREEDETFTVTLSGAKNADAERMQATGTIVDDERLAQRRRAMRYALAAFGRTVAETMVAAVEERAAAARGPVAAVVRGTIAGHAVSPDAIGSGEEMARFFEAFAEEDGSPRPVGSDDALSSSSFDLSPAEGKGGWALWGRGAAAEFEGRPAQDFSMEGAVLSGHVGFDLRAREGLLAGLAMNRSEGDVDWRFTDGPESTLDARVTSVHPYLHWSPRPDLGVWAMLGYGRGEAVLDEGDAEAVAAALEMRMAAAGARKELGLTGWVDWALKGGRVRGGDRDRGPAPAAARGGGRGAPPAAGAGGHGGRRVRPRVDGDRSGRSGGAARRRRRRQRRRRGGRRQRGLRRPGAGPGRGRARARPGGARGARVQGVGHEPVAEVRSGSAGRGSARLGGAVLGRRGGRRGRRHGRAVAERPDGGDRRGGRGREPHHGDAAGGRGRLRPGPDERPCPRDAVRCAERVRR